ncbi:M23 family metallopeptidase [Devosia sp. SL43]|uniref:M23 family metallopeptidase n=1 Tax=Devosia sp. SL43 TaxID=2806348 RepID=UPI001F289C10|nr:M23 family metallopeptidase [Devosia sp. SL43]UJW85970.1 peptidoglycan DD-metalloendopeptidase family protein [Devosia sp. SL43]
MSIRVSRRAPKGAVAMVGLVAAAVALSGCSSLGSRAFSDPTTTSAIPQTAPQSINQPMPSSLGAPQSMVAESQFLPPANVGGGGFVGQPAAQPAWNQPAQTAFSQPLPALGGAAPAVQTQSLPALNSPPQGTLPAMQAQPAIASASMPSPAALGSLPTNSSVPTLASVTPAAPAVGGTFTHTIASGESLYTIARRYEVTTQAIVQANSLSSPDKIVVGQKVIIPGRADLLATKAPTTQVAAATPMAAPTPTQQTLPQAAPNALQTAAAPAPLAAPAAAPVHVANAPAAQPVAAPAPAASAGFRWPVSGRVLVDFASSKGTGINIEVPEGTSVKAADNGTVIYVGSGVEGYGNLILIRHPNGYVSAYAHLGSMSVAKGANVNRGDSIGAAGMTGSVTKPQLHFELRKGATPVDPVPLLAS